MLIIHHTLHNNRKKVLIVRHTPENRLKNKILSYTHKNNSLSCYFFCFSGLLQHSCNHALRGEPCPCAADRKRREMQAQSICGHRTQRT